MNKEEGTYDRYLRPLDAWALAFGCMVGWGCFVMPGTTFIPLAGPAGTIIAMLIGALLMFVIGNNFAYLMNKFPSIGGCHTYTKKAYGRDHAFLCSWFLCLSYLTIVFLNGTALFLVVKTVLGSSIQFGTYYTIGENVVYLSEVILSVVTFAVIGLVFALAKPVLQYMQTIFASLLFIGVTIIGFMCIPLIVKNGVITAFGINNLNVAYAIFSIVIMAPWAFVGFEVISFETAHFKFPIKKSKSIIFVGIILAALAYTGMALTSVSAIPDGYASWIEYIKDISNLSGVVSVPTFYAAESVIGKPGLIIITITAISAILTGIIAAYRASTRILMTMADDNILSEKFNKTTYSVLFIMFISIIVSLVGRNTLVWFVDLTSFGAIVGFGYTSGAAYKIAKEEGNQKVKTTGLVGLIISIAFIVVVLVPRLIALDAMSAESFLLLSLWCLLGFVFYWRTVNNHIETEGSGMSVSGVALFALLLYSILMWLAKHLAATGSMEEMRKTLYVGGAIALVVIIFGFFVMMYIQDLIRKKHAVTEVARIKAEEGSKAKSQFLFNMSHDIRTPMNAIIGYTGLALKEDDTNKVSDYLVKIDNSSKHLLALINDILEMSRIENGRFEIEEAPTDLNVVLNDIYDLFSEQMKQKNINFTVNMDDVKHQYAYCDKKNLNRVLLNLVGNAYKFTPNDGAITVTLKEKDNDNEYASYILSVKDTGKGMSKEFVSRMFNAFERESDSTTSRIEGTGLGLAITKNIIDLMNGTIDVQTEVDKGTDMVMNFKFKIAQKEDIEASEETNEVTHQTDFANKRILLAEDNKINQEIATIVLSQLGFIVETAEDGKDAVDKVAASTPGYYDVVIMDIQMPVMDGFTATRHIRELENKELANIPIIAMTANAFKEDEQAALDAGMQAHIAKPIDINDITRKLSMVLSNK